MIIVQTLHWVQFAGTEKVCVDLCNELAKKHRVYLFSKEAIKPYLSNNVVLIPIDFEKNRHNPLFIYQLAKHIKKIQPDIIHCHNAKELEVMYHARLFMHKKIPLIATRHNPLIKKKFKLADLGIAVSDETFKYINSNKKIRILNGILEKKAKSIFDKNTFNIVAIGRLAPVKGFDLLIEALSLVNFSFTLRIVGEGEQREPLQQLIQEKELEKQVHLVGFVNNVQDYIYSSDLQVISSKEEGLSLALLEGIFYAKTLIASDIANHKILLGNTLVFDNSVQTLAEKLNHTYHNYNTYCEKFEFVKATKDIYSVKRMTEQYEHAYHSLLGEHL